MLEKRSMQRMFACISNGKNINAEMSQLLFKYSLAYYYIKKPLPPSPQPHLN